MYVHTHSRMASVSGLMFCAIAAQVSATGDQSPSSDARPSILFCIADDWSYPHAGVYGDKVVKTPTFDRLAESGVLFTHAFCAAPSCTPSRGAILTGQAIHRLEEGGNLWSRLPGRFKVYPDLLEQAGYFVGCTGKGWGPGTIEGTGRTRNPAGPLFARFRDFLEKAPAGQPFCFWFGSTDPHRPYEKGSGVKAGMKLREVVVPPWLPDTPEVRSDILDYYVEVQRFDSQVGELLRILDEKGLRDNTIVVVTSDNGMPFPRSKTNLYDSGTRMPLVVSWPARMKGKRVVDELVSFTDFAPTFLEAARLTPPLEMTGRGLLDLLTGKTDKHHDHVFLERERHANVRQGDASFPARAVRTKAFLYVRNLRPELWPAGDPEKWQSVGPFGDIDASPSKDVIIDRRDDPLIAPFFKLACARRPAEELYDLAKDPGQIRNVADDPAYAEAKRELRALLDRWMAETADPRASGVDDRYDRYPYYGSEVKKPNG